MSPLIHVTCIPCAGLDVTCVHGKVLHVRHWVPHVRNWVPYVQNLPIRIADEKQCQRFGTRAVGCLIKEKARRRRKRRRRKNHERKWRKDLIGENRNENKGENKISQRQRRVWSGHFGTFWDIEGHLETLWDNSEDILTSLEHLDCFPSHFRPFSPVIGSLKKTRDRPTDRQTDGPRDGGTDGQTLL